MNIKGKKVISLLLGMSIATALTGCGALAGQASDSVNIHGVSVDLDDYIELGEYKDLVVPLDVSEVTQEEIDAQLEMMASYYAEEEIITEGEILEGDTANIDYVGTKDGVEFDGGSFEGYNLAIGSGTFIPGFEDGLIGVSVGETVELPLTFPEGYQNEELAGQDVIFTVTVNSISRSKLPEINDEFVQRITGGIYNDVDSLSADIKAQIAAENEAEARNNYGETVWEAVIGNTKFKKDVPSEIVNNELIKSVSRFYDTVKSTNMSMDSLLQNYGMTTKEFDEEIIGYITEDVKGIMVATAIAKKENIEVTDQEINDMVQQYMIYGGYASEDEIFSMYPREDMRTDLLVDKVKTLVTESAKQQ